MRIGVDMDGVLFPWTKCCNEALRRYRGVQGLGEHEYWNYVKDKITKEDWKWVWTAGAGKVFNHPDAFYPFAPTFLREICKDNHVEIVTHRPKQAAVFTYTWVARRKAPVAAVKIVGPGVPKSTAGEYDVFIDDRDTVIEDILLNTQADVLVPRRPWNEEYLETAADFVRVTPYNGLKEALEWLKTRP